MSCFFWVFTTVLARIIDPINGRAASKRLIKEAIISVCKAAFKWEYNQDIFHNAHQQRNLIPAHMGGSGMFVEPDYF